MARLDETLGFSLNIGQVDRPRLVHYNNFFINSLANVILLVSHVHSLVDRGLYTTAFHTPLVSMYSISLYLVQARNAWFDYCAVHLRLILIRFPFRYI
jgi:hypothetical protein